MTAGEMADEFAKLPRESQVMMDITKDGAKEFHFIAINFIGEVGVDTENGRRKIIVVGKNDFESDEDNRVLPEPSLN